MLRRIFPLPADNRFRGHPFALWLFVPLTLVVIVRSCLHVFLGDGGAQSIATIPLDTFSTGAVATVISIFALWGLSQLLLALIFAVVWFRYRALISLMYLIFLVENLGRIAIGMGKPVFAVETPPGAPGSYIFALVSLVGLILSLRWREDPSPAPGG